MSCPYYYWNGDYACRKIGKDVSEDIYYKWCRAYDYASCSVYKEEGNNNQQDDSNCFLTTACIRTKNLPDNCYELKILREFRDGYIMGLPDGAAMIKRYYEIAPQIVKRISGQLNATEIYQEIYNRVIVPCVHLIERRENEKAYECYKDMVTQLQAKYLQE